MAKDIIKIDMEKAKDIYRDILRSVRKPRLEELDLEFMKSIESGNTALQAEISAKKQELRDLPADPIIDSVKKTSDFKNIFPDSLKPDMNEVTPKV